LHISNSKEHEEIGILSIADTSIVAEFSSIDVNMPQHYKVNISLCTTDLIRKYNFDLASGIINNEDEFVKKIVNRIVSQTQNQIENYIWAGNAEECNMNGLLTLANSNE